MAGVVPGPLAGESAGMFVVFGVVALAMVLFVTEPVPVDVTAILLMVLLVVLEPWTAISPEDGVSGLSNPATVTVLAMFVLSEGVRRSGAVQVLARKIAAFSGDDERRQLASVVGVSGLSAGVVNNTPVVAMMIPLVTDLARRTGTSPSKLLIPVSYASMFGGMLTLIGTSTNILASDVSRRLIGHPFSMFEFTHLGAVVLLTGGLYLLFVGPYLIPGRVQPADDLTTEYEMDAYLSEILVSEGAPLAGATIGEARAAVHPGFDVVQVVRNGAVIPEPPDSTTIDAGDVLVVRATRATLVEFVDGEGLEFLPEVQFADADFRTRSGDEERTLVEVVVVPEARVTGETLASANFGEQYDATVLALRRGSELVHERLDRVPLRGGDTLLVRATERSVERLDVSREFVVTQRLESPGYRREKIPVALAIVLGVVAVAALGLYPILVTALAGVVAMVLTGCVRPTELYEAVDWSVIFLLAGVIPLGIALERTGGAAFLANAIVAGTGGFPPVVVLGLFYLATTLITEAISNNASVVLMIPVGVDAATQIGANPFAFVLAVTFAASTSILSPIGYQTNLMVYGPGGYRFSDFFRVGAPLQVVLTVVTTLGIAAIWGV